MGLEVDAEGLRGVGEGSEAAGVLFGGEVVDGQTERKGRERQKVTVLSSSVLLLYGQGCCDD